MSISVAYRRSKAGHHHNLADYSNDWSEQLPYDPELFTGVREPQAYIKVDTASLLGCLDYQLDSGVQLPELMMAAR